MRDTGLLLLRLSGLYMALAHGWGKVSALASGKGSGFVDGVAALGFPLPQVFAWAAALSEFIGGLALAAGLFTRWSAATLAVTMIVAAFARHRALQQGLAVVGLHGATEETRKAWGSPELALIYLLCTCGPLLLGPGRFSLDHLWRGKGRRKK